MIIATKGSKKYKTDKGYESLFTAMRITKKNSFFGQFERGHDKVTCMIMVKLNYHM
jgi:hypothetical protein